MKTIIYEKLKNSFYRFISWIYAIPKRLNRIIHHILNIRLIFVNNPRKPEYYRFHFLLNFLIWLIEFLFFLLDLCGIPELFMTIQDLSHLKARKLTIEEKRITHLLFNGQVNTIPVLINQYSNWVSKKWNIVFVTYDFINSWGRFDKILFSHEITHVWQYQKYGSVYMLRALLAQHSKMGYDLGGVDYLKHINESNIFQKLNYEQQAEIFEHWFLNTYQTPETLNNNEYFYQLNRIRLILLDIVKKA